jgi:hypothetical protein
MHVTFILFSDTEYQFGSYRCDVNNKDKEKCRLSQTKGGLLNIWEICLQRVSLQRWKPVVTKSST